MGILLLVIFYYETENRHSTTILTKNRAITAQWSAFNVCPCRPAVVESDSFQSLSMFWCIALIAFMMHLRWRLLNQSLTNEYRAFEAHLHFTLFKIVVGYSVSFSLSFLINILNSLYCVFFPWNISTLLIIFSVAMFKLFVAFVEADVYKTNASAKGTHKHRHVECFMISHNDAQVIKGECFVQFRSQCFNLNAMLFMSSAAIFNFIFFFPSQVLNNNTEFRLNHDKNSRAYP